MSYSMMPGLYMKELVDNYKNPNRQYNDIKGSNSPIQGKYDSLKSPKLDTLKIMSSDDIKKTYHVDTLGLFYGGMGEAAKQNLLDISKWVYSNSTN